MMDWTAFRRATLDPNTKSVLPPGFQPPALPQPVLAFSRKADDPNVGVKELGRVIESDVGLTLELLKHANSSAMGLRHKAASAQHAISILGVRHSKLLLLTKAIQNAINLAGAPLFELTEFWNANLERGLFAREVAALVGGDAETAFTGGMLQDFLLPALTTHAREKYEAFVRGQDEFPMDLVQFEGECLAWDHAKEAARLLVEWSFPDELVCCVLCHHRGLSLLANEKFRQSSVAAVAASGLLPDPINQSPGGLEMLRELEEILPDFCLLDVAERVEQEFQTHVLQAGSYQTLHSLLMTTSEAIGA